LACIIAGQAHTIARAERLAREANYDLALLDVNIGHETIDTVADIVAERYPLSSQPDMVAPVCQKLIATALLLKSPYVDELFKNAERKVLNTPLRLRDCWSLA
jgi:hypothetical protein